MPPERPIRHQDVDAAYQALGRYVYEFSRLCVLMKRAISQIPRLDGPGIAVVELLTGEMTAAPLANACFAVCEAHVATEPAHIRMVRALRKKVMEVIGRRNDLLHGDWMIGWRSTAGVELPDGSVQFESRELPPTMSRVQPGRGGDAKRRQEEIPLYDLEAEADRVRDLRQTLADFLNVLEGLAFIAPQGTTDDHLNRVLEIVTLSDVYEFAPTGGLTRTGPRADEVWFWPGD